MKKVRIACVLQAPGSTREKRLAEALRLLDDAAKRKADLAMLSEAFAEDMNAPVAEPLDGPVISAVADKARAHGMTVVAPIYELTPSGERYNTAVLIGRDGRVQGAYRKNIPYWAEKGVTPGRERRVFDTPLGKIGILICFEDQWPEPWAEMARLGAEIVLWPSAYSGGRKLVAPAIYHNLYVVSCTRIPDTTAVDICGEVIRHTQGAGQVVVHELNLDRTLVHRNFNQLAIRKLAEDMGDRINIRTFEQEGWFLLESTDPSLSVRETLKERDIEPLREYVRRSFREIGEMRDARKPLP